jgi:hypothetical protein
MWSTHSRRIDPINRSANKRSIISAMDFGPVDGFATSTMNKSEDSKVEGK